MKTIVIPARVDHEGYYQIQLNRVRWVCLYCGGPRGEPFKTLSYDGSRWIFVDGWINPCGHVEKYSAVRGEDNGKGCFCFTCGKHYHPLGIARHVAAHRDRKEYAEIRYTSGAIKRFDYTGVPI